MKFYFSGTLGQDIDLYFLSLKVSRLFSCAYEREIYRNCEMIRYHEYEGYDLIIDSGAFSAWNAGKPMTMDDMLRVWDRILTAYPENNYTFISLDVIPGTRGVPRTESDYKVAREQSMENYDALTRRFPDLRILPVYHAPEPYEVMYHYLAKTDHIAISIDASLAEKQRVEILQEVYPRREGVKVHGLATTGLNMLRCVDWYSVDSATWAMIGAMGGLLWLNEDETEFIKVPISIESPRRRTRNSHIDSHTAADYAYDRIRHYGFDPETLRMSYKERAKWNILMWHKLKVRPVKSKQQGLFEL